MRPTMCLHTPAHNRARVTLTLASLSLLHNACAAKNCGELFHFSATCNCAAHSVWRWHDNIWSCSLQYEEGKTVFLASFPIWCLGMRWKHGNLCVHCVQAIIISCYVGKTKYKFPMKIDLRHHHLSHINSVYPWGLFCFGDILHILN